MVTTSAFGDASCYKEKLINDGLLSCCSEEELLYGVFLFAAEGDTRLDKLLRLQKPSPRRGSPFSEFTESLLADDCVAKMPKHKLKALARRLEPWVLANGDPSLASSFLEKC